MTTIIGYYCILAIRMELRHVEECDAKKRWHHPENTMGVCISPTAIGIDGVLCVCVWCVRAKRSWHFSRNIGNHSSKSSRSSLWKILHLARCGVRTGTETDECYVRKSHISLLYLTVVCVCVCVRVGLVWVLGDITTNIPLIYDLHVTGWVAGWQDLVTSEMPRHLFVTLENHLFGYCYDPTSSWW